MENEKIVKKIKKSAQDKIQEKLAKMKELEKEVKLLEKKELNKKLKLITKEIKIKEYNDDDIKSLIELIKDFNTSILVKKEMI